MTNLDRVLQGAVTYSSPKDVFCYLAECNLEMSDVYRLAEMIDARDVCKWIDDGEFETVDHAIDNLTDFILEAYGDCTPELEAITKKAFEGHDWGLGDSELTLMADYVFCCETGRQVEKCLQRFSLLANELTRLARRSHFSKIMRKYNCTEVSIVKEFCRLWDKWATEFAVFRRVG